MLCAVTTPEGAPSIMFKAPKRAKKRKQVLSTVADSSSDEERGTSRVRVAPSSSRDPQDDGDEDNDGDEGGEGGIGALEAAQMKIKARKDRQRKKKQKRGAVSAGIGGGMSFNAEDDEEVDGFDDGAGVHDRNSSNKKDRKKKRKKDEKKKRKNRSGGMGFGGATILLHDDDEEEAADAAAPAGLGGSNGDVGGGDATDGSSLYDAAALEALRSKQKIYVAPRGDDGDKVSGSESKSKQDSAATSESNRMDVEKPDTSTSTPKPKSPGLGDGETNFIPLHDGSNIVAGDDALAYMEEEDDEKEGMANPEAHAARRKDKRTMVGIDRLSISGGDVDGVVVDGGIFGGMVHSKDAEIDAGGRQWEEEVARRAGIRGQHGGGQATASSPAAMLETMRGTISKTLTHLRQRREDLESSHDRRHNELQGVEDELRRQEDDLRAGGSSFEYYQELRVEIADWVGALRNLSTKVETIVNTIQEQETDSAEQQRLRSRQREDDFAAILHSKSLLDSIIGRKIQQSDENNTTPTVDEFGRDIQSAEALARERRIVRRRRVRKESSERIEKRQKAQQQRQDADAEAACSVDDSDADLSDNEVEEQAQRMDALEEALLLAKGELDDRYCSLSALQDLFLSWAKHSPDDYRRCYAKLSLVDLSAVLVKTETCTKINTLRCTNDSDSDVFNLANFDWVVTASSFESSKTPQVDKDQDKEKSSKGKAENNSDSDEGEEKLVSAISRKAILPYLLLLLGVGADGHAREPLYDPFSSHQTDMVKSLLHFLKIHTDAKALQRCTKNILTVFKAIIENSAVLLVKPDALNVLEDKETDGGAAEDQQTLKDAVTFSIFEQAHRLQKLSGNAASLSSQLGDKSEPQRELASLILMEVIAARLLPILSLLQNTEISGAQQADATLQQVFKDIKEAGWLDDEALMLQTAPIRAALASLDKT